jgi:hypothetical protein
MPPVVVPSSTFGSLPSPGTPGSLARVTDQTRGLWMDQNTHWSQVGGGVVNATDFATLQDAVDSFGPSPDGGTVLVPAGTYTLTTPLDLDGRRHIRLIGMGRLDNPSKIVYTGTGSAVISCLSSAALEFRNLSISYSSGSFTGHVIDFAGTNPSPSFFSVVADCALGGATTDTRGAASLINLDYSFTMVIARNNFHGCQYAIRGRSSEGFCNVIQIFGNHFSGAIEQCGMRDAGQNWLIQGNTFEPLRPVGGTNPVGAYTQAYGSVNVVFDGNWFGDGTNHGTWISWFGSGLTVSNNYMTSGSRAILINGSSCYGINVTGNFFAGSAAGNMAEAINLNGEPNAQTGIVIAGNVFDSSVTTPIANLHHAHRQVSIDANFPDTMPVITRGGSSIRFQSTTQTEINANGTMYQRGFTGSPSGVEVHIRPHANNRGLVTFTEDTVADRWVFGTKPGDANLYFGTGNAIANTDRVIVRSDGGITQTGAPRFSGPNPTGAGSASLGANCPATTTTAPYKWIQVTTQDGSTAYVPCWK